MIVWFVLLLGEFFHPPVPFLLDVVEGSVNLSFGPSLFTGVVILLLSFSFVLVDFLVGRGRGGGQGKGGCRFSGFESSLVGDTNGERWW